jgi:hypothetical protein
MSLEKAAEELKSKLRGELIASGDPQFEKARQVYNAMIDRRPRWIRALRDVADVVASVNFARENTSCLRFAEADTTPPVLESVTEGWSSTSRQSATHMSIPKPGP